MTQTIALTPDVLRALAEGLDRLNDGDNDNRAAADRVDMTLADAGYLRSGLSIWAAGPAEVAEWKETQVRDAAKAVAEEAAWAEKWAECKAQHPGVDEHDLYSQYSGQIWEEILKGR